MTAPSLSVASIRKNSREEVRISLDVFNGQRLFNSRVFFEAEDGVSRPGKAGLALRLECLEAYAEAVTSALLLAKSKGFLK